MRDYLYVCFLLFLTASLHAVDLSRPNSDKGPTQVFVTVKILDIDSIDSQDQSFQANLFLRATWKDSRLAHDGSGPIGLGMEEAWHPDLQILSQQKAWRTFKERLRVMPDGTVIWRQRLWGSFSQPMDLRDFPFDSQRFSIQILPTTGDGNDVLVLTSATDIPSNIADNLSVADWTISPPQIAVNAMDVSPTQAPISMYEFSFEAERNSGYFIAKVIVPLLLIVAMSWIVFWIDPTEFGTQISVAITTMLTLIAYRFAIDGLLPKVSYLSALDYFILASTVLIFATLIEVIITGNLAKKESELERARSIDRRCRMILPLLFVVVALDSLWLRILL